MIKLKSLRKKKPEIAQEVSVGYQPKPTLNKATFLLVFGVLLAAASFYEGIAFQRNADTSGSGVLASNSSSAQNQPSESNAQADSFTRGHVLGQVTAVSSNSITIQDQRTGSNTTLGINSSTQIETNGQTANVSDIQTGDLVIVTKTSNNSSTASKIIIAPGDIIGGSNNNQSNTSSTSATPLQDLSTN